MVYNNKVKDRAETKRQESPEMQEVKYARKLRDARESRESWKPVLGFDNYLISSRGRLWNRNLKRFMKASEDKRGRLRVKLTNKKKVFVRFLHLLVAEAFLPKKDGLDVIGFKDGDKSNCFVENLYRCTQSDIVGKVRGKRHKLISPGGDVVIITNISKFCRENSMHRNLFYELLRGVRSSYYGWKLK